MDFGLAGRVALITGAARGIGAAIARTLAAEGCDVALVDLCFADGSPIPATTAANRVHLCEADVRDLARAEAVVAETVATLGGLDILVCNAGITRDGMSWKLSERDWDDVIAVNLKGSFAYCRAAAPVLRARGWGRIVTISSINGLRGKVGQASYAASKAGVIALSRTLARELGPRGVTVNVVAPGFVDSEMTASLPDDVKATSLRETVLGRVANVDDVADVVTFLCSTRAAHVTGAVIRVDGGQYM